MDHRMGVGSRMELVGHLLRAAWNSSGKCNNYGKSSKVIQDENVVVNYPKPVTHPSLGLGHQFSKFGKIFTFDILKIIFSYFSWYIVFLYKKVNLFKFLAFSATGTNHTFVTGFTMYRTYYVKLLRIFDSYAFK